MVVALVSLLAGYAWLCLQICRFAADEQPADAAIVLGAAAWGEQPSPVFEQRIAHSVRLFQARRVKSLIFTGGRAKMGDPAESFVAKRYAIAHGVPAEAIFCEDASRITWENLQGAKSIVDQLHFRRVLIVSDPLHMRRAISMARDSGLDAHPSPTSTTRYVGWRARTKFVIREAWFYGLYLLERSLLRSPHNSYPPKAPPVAQVDKLRVMKGRHL